MSEEFSTDRRVTGLIWANCALAISIIFGSGIMYQREVAVEVEVNAIKLRLSQLDTLAAMQAQIKALEGEVIRARDRIDRAIDARDLRDAK